MSANTSSTPDQTSTQDGARDLRLEYITLPRPDNRRLRDTDKSQAYFIMSKDLSDAVSYENLVSKIAMHVASRESKPLIQLSKTFFLHSEVKSAIKKALSESGVNPGTVELKDQVLLMRDPTHLSSYCGAAKSLGGEVELHPEWWQ
jgi:hypothetical protein